jgi:hypothetical protein
LPRAFLEFPTHEAIEFLVGAPELNVRFDGCRIITLE